MSFIMNTYVCVCMVCVYLHIVQREPTGVSKHIIWAIKPFLKSCLYEILDNDDLQLHVFSSTGAGEEKERSS